MTAITFPAMGGEIEVQLPDGPTDGARRVEALFVEHERVMSRFLPDSELCAMNAHASRGFGASPLLFDVVSEALSWARVTDGVFDPTVIDVLEASGYDRTFDQIAGGTAAVSARPTTPRGTWRDIEMDPDRRVITMPEGVRIDLGGIGKGYSVDRAIALLGSGANAMVNASGDLYAAGDGPDGDGWYVGVQDPFNPDADIAVLNVNDCGVATSGSIKRRWTRRRYALPPPDRRARTAKRDE